MEVIIIPAKKFSSRLASKNMLLINEQPMLYWTIIYALKGASKEAIFVSSDCQETCKFASDLGIRSILRPSYLTGDVPILDVYRHAIVYLEASRLCDNISAVIGLQPDHPDRRVPLKEARAVFSEKNLDRLSSRDASGEKNGAHYILSRQFLDGGESSNDFSIIDDCTNVHFEEDLVRAEDFLKANFK
jgi:CMP-N,N'-diacetyllegionaminic acid synthase